MTVIARKKLIEVALPLEAINAASAREKSIRHGHPSTLHLWWARRPLSAARAVIFAQLVDDPSTYVEALMEDPAKKHAGERELSKRYAAWLERKAQYGGTTTNAGDRAGADPGAPPTLTEVLADMERERLFDIIRALVKWDNTTNHEVLQAARTEIWQSWQRACTDNSGHPRANELFNPHSLPAFHDPFAGGGALPLEAQRLGMESHASDLNPVAVMINKAMLEIPSRFAGRPPVNPDAQKLSAQMDKRWHGAQGLAEDLRYYGQWMRDEAEKRLAHLYPKVEVTAEMARDRPDLKSCIGQKLTVVAWLWARTVRSPNPAFAEVDVPLASTFMLSAKAGKEAYVAPVIENDGYRFTVKLGQPKDAKATASGTKLARANFRCLMSGSPITGDYIKSEGKAGRLGARLMAIVVEGEHGRTYVPPIPEHAAAALRAKSEWRPDVTISGSTQYLGVKPYGMDRFDQLFTERQLVALTTFSDLVSEAGERAKRDAVNAGITDDSAPLRSGGEGATAYADAVKVYLAFCLDKMTDTNTCVCSWQVDPPRLRATFGRQAFPMVWDYAEANVFGDAAGDFARCVGSLTEVLDKGGLFGVGSAEQADAQTLVTNSPRVISTDPPYYDNVPYADLSDFFYLWLRRSLQQVFPNLFATVVVPKSEELVAFAYRHDGKAGAEAFFLQGMTQAMRRLAANGHPAFPVTIYYAFKQSEHDSEAGTASTGWETFLDAVLRAGFSVTGTWPMRSELATRNRGRDANALASSIVLVCHQGVAEAPSGTRRDFVNGLKTELPQALIHLQRGNIAPVDLAQAAIGPGMAVYSRYSKVLDAQGKPLTVREALALINQTLDEALAEQEGDFDADSRFAITWFDQMGFAEGEFGQANVLAQAKNTGMDGLVEAGIVRSARGKVRLLKPDELAADWDPAHDARLTAWETVHQLIRALEVGGEAVAAALVTKLGAKAEAARELAYRLYSLCERRKRPAEALSYNALVQSWPQIVELAKQAPAVQPNPTQAGLV